MNFFKRLLAKRAKKANSKLVSRPARNTVSPNVQGQAPTVDTSSPGNDLLITAVLYNTIVSDSSPSSSYDSCPSSSYDSGSSYDCGSSSYDSGSSSGGFDSGSSF